MGTRINIGVYIGSDDADIATWFNLLQDNNLSRAKWASGLFCAYAMNQKLDIGTINPSAPLVKGNAVGEALYLGQETARRISKKETAMDTAGKSVDQTGSSYKEVSSMSLSARQRSYPY